MSTTSIPTISNLGSSVLSNQGGTFGDNPFLQLLTEQLKNQTPLQPVDDASFMNQMATYSSMQQQQDLNKNMLSLLDYQGVLARMQGLSQGSALLGKDVTYRNAQGHDVTDTVTSVYVADDGSVHLKVTGGDDLPLGAVTAIANPPARS
jgi:flagellar basal-body rod modification protein FlgD